METIRILSYFIIGTLLIGCFFMLFVNQRVKRHYRFGVSFLYLFTGAFFMSVAGDIMDKESTFWELPGLVIGFLSLFAGLRFLYYIRYKSK